LADERFYIPAAVDILLGAELFPFILKPGKVIGTPSALNTIFGFVVLGSSSGKQNDSSLSLFLGSPQCDSLSIESAIKRFWELEDISANHLRSPEDSRCEEIFNTTHYRDDEGRYVVNLPFKESEPTFCFQNTRNIALKRFYSLERRLI
ncbi:hypothetical protein PPYR_15509, partial [Photinus pyralis]